MSGVSIIRQTTCINLLALESFLFLVVLAREKAVHLESSDQFIRFVVFGYIQLGRPFYHEHWSYGRCGDWWDLGIIELRFQKGNRRAKVCLIVYPWESSKD